MTSPGKSNEQHVHDRPEAGDGVDEARIWPSILMGMGLVAVVLGVPAYVLQSKLQAASAQQIAQASACVRADIERALQSGRADPVSVRDLQEREARCKADAHNRLLAARGQAPSAAQQLEALGR